MFNGEREAILLQLRGEVECDLPSFVTPGAPTTKNSTPVPSNNRCPYIKPPV